MGHNSLGVGRALRPVTLVGAPQVDIAEAEGAPPGVQHRPVEAQDAIASDVRGGRSKRGEAVIDARPIRFADAGEQMPERESVALARVREDDAKQGGTFHRRDGGKIKFRQGALKRSGRDRKSTRLNSSHGYISYAVFCLK